MSALPDPRPYPIHNYAADWTPPTGPPPPDTPEYREELAQKYDAMAVDHPSEMARALLPIMAEMLRAGDPFVTTEEMFAQLDMHYAEQRRG